MDFDLTQIFETTSVLFRVLVLLGVGVAYVAFEALLSRKAASRGLRDTQDTTMALEPFVARVWSSKTTD